MAFLTAMTMTAGAMGVTAYAEENDGNTYQYNYSEADKIEATPEMEPVIELKCNEMKQYLLENAVPENIADEIVSYYAKGLPRRIYFGNIGLAPEEGTNVEVLGQEAEIDIRNNREFCMNIALLMMQRETFGVDKETEAEIEEKLYNLSKALTGKHGHTNPAQDIYYGDKLSDNTCTLKCGVELHYNPETNVIILDGSGTVTADDAKDILRTTAITDEQGYGIEGLVPTLIVGKNVDIGSIALLVNPALFKTYLYKGTQSDESYKKQHDWHEQHRKDMAAIGVKYTGGGSNNLYADYIDESVDPYDVLYGKVDITVIEQPAVTEEETTVTDETEAQVVREETTASENTEVKVLAEKPASTMKGDADLNGEVSLTDVVVVSKNNLSDEAYPLANDTAYENADMNNDNKVNGLDTSALIENQLGK